MKKIMAFILLGLASLGASAEKADAGKQAVIEYDALHVDDLTQVTTLTGHVVVTKGTLVLRSHRAVIRQSPEGDMRVTLTSAGQPAAFRQKRDGGADLWVEGEAERIEYDERSAIVTLSEAAKVRQLEGTRLADQIQGEFISYDSLREVFNAGRGRGRMILAPRKPRAAVPAPAAPAAPVSTGTP